ncbi:RNA polymerase sigma factor [Goekera deserti]|uniref:Sigma-70 family RNA polymerase sigma factor n=1 Tax=Goekera deserti TaxID=2497753 RepID=A0A7K3WDY8_9ACTN|nr:sigma-70 family RNA polymerase sigma factor [Goekera deserti]NDI46443.1 sigma-70 family RNA polymerase sigma factor [Goekera deserti]NEL54624.1 sigma-70 family RNA polymerase sigma factor [Goekera deserti]
MTEASDATFDRLWSEHAAAVVRYARAHVLPDDVEDVVAETFVVAWRRLDEIPDLGLPWLLGVARGISANARRSRRRQGALNDRLMSLGETRVQNTPEDDWPLFHDGSTMAALRALPESDRELLTLLAWDGLSQEEAAEVLGCSRGALKVRLHRARRRFAQLTDVAHEVTHDRDPAPHLGGTQ